MHITTNKKMSAPDLAEESQVPFVVQTGNINTISYTVLSMKDIIHETLFIQQRQYIVHVIVDNRNVHSLHDLKNTALP